MAKGNCGELEGDECLVPDTESVGIGDLLRNYMYIVEYRCRIRDMVEMERRGQARHSTWVLDVGGQVELTPLLWRCLRFGRLLFQPPLSELTL